MSLGPVITKWGAGPRRAHARRTWGTLFALVLHTVRLQRRSALIWGLALGIYSAAIVATFPTFGDMEQMDQLMRAYPEGLREASNIEDMGTPEGFLDSQVFSLAPLALAFFPILACAGAIAGAEERQTLDVLLGNPLPRWQLVVGSFLATALSLLGIAAVVGLFTWGTALLFDVDLSLLTTAAAVLNLWPICLFFGGLALLCSALLHRRALATAIPGVALFAAYLADVLGKVSDDLEDLRPASVFYYYGTAIKDGIDWANFAGVTLAALFCVLLAVLAFSRRDIYT
ncbi:MAG TPA: ABC transporter permease subunit [Rubrobacteraceae bacterium]|nr:ABC transporter permease subunit [Rubrobacteraceae bacterium]